MKRLFHNNQKGVTFPELLLTMAIFLLLGGFVTVNLVRSTQRVTITSTVNKLVADIKSQQLKAMNGATDGQGAATNYSIFFQSNKYVLFRGSTYVASDPSNFIILIDNRMNLTTTIPAGTLVFSQQSGEVAGFVSGQNTITLRTIDGTSQKIITLNKYGIITSVQ